MKGRSVQISRIEPAEEDDQPPSSSQSTSAAGKILTGPEGSLLQQLDNPPTTIPSKRPSAKNRAPIRISESKVASTKLVRAKRPANLIGISSRSEEFRSRYYPETSEAEWNDWHWQVRNRMRTFDHLTRVLRLSLDEQAAVSRSRDSLPLGITPYYASLLDPENPFDGLRRTVVPVQNEFIQSPGEKRDPLGEEGDSHVPGVVHRYPDRVLFLVSAFCSVYCRYCTRSRVVGNFGEYRFNRKQWEQGIDYIERTPSIRDVLISGGDPLDLSDENLEWLVSRIRAIKHVEFLRIGTKVPAVLPQRVTLQLTRMLKKYHPLWMSLHFTHPNELTAETIEACNRLADAGIPLGSQTVLLKGVNDSVETMKQLFHGLLRSRVRPYYLYQCDPILGSAHFRTSVEKGLEIIRGLRGHTSGYAVPQYVIDAPGGGGKIPLLPEYFLGREGDDVLLRNFEGNVYRYPDPKTDPSS
ncbi:MAG: KamA family radical SAM protein [Bdellovibrionota bacterium]